MYWLRVDDLLEPLIFAFLCSGWAVGGWLLATYAFQLKRRERLVAGLALGWVSFMTLANLLANLAPHTAAYWLSAAAILVFGIGVARQVRKQAYSPSAVDNESGQAGREVVSEIPRRPFLQPLTTSLSSWSPLAALLGFTWLFALIQRGLALFDDYLHIPLVSIMAAGDIPPHFYLNPEVKFAYHYGLHIFAAGLTRLGGLFPWSAWDLSKALAIAFTLVLGWLWVLRLTRSHMAAVLGSLLFSFGGGARWLLLLLPATLLECLSPVIDLTNSGTYTAHNLLEAMIRPWLIEGDGPMPFPFAFHSGIFVPVISFLGSNGALPYLTVLLLLILAPRKRFTTPGMLGWGLVFTSLALSAEHLFAFLWAGIALVVGSRLVADKFKGQPATPVVRVQWVGILVASAVLAIVQGGFITETARGLVMPYLDGATGSYHAFSFSLRWPPALFSAHFGELLLLDWRSFTILVAELGPALLLAPLMAVYLSKRWARTTWMQNGLVASSFISILFPALFKYGVDRSITRMAATALWTWMVVGFPVLWNAAGGYKPTARYLAGAAYFIATFSGVVIFAMQLISIPVPQISYYIDWLDGAMAKEYWDRLPAGAQVLDRAPSRSAAVLGRIPRAHAGIYEPLGEWEALLQDPDPVQVSRAGYGYIYIDYTWWDSLNLEQRQAFEQPCVRLLVEQWRSERNFRRLYDVSACSP